LNYIEGKITQRWTWILLPFQNCYDCIMIELHWARYGSIDGHKRETRNALSNLVGKFQNASTSKT